MANNCLVTKLKGEINNSNLPVLGYEKYNVNLTGLDFGMIIKLSQAGRLILLNGTWSSNNLRELDVEANVAVYANSSYITPDNIDQDYCEILIPKYTCYYYGNFYPIEGQDIVDYTGFKYGSAENAADIYISTYAPVKIKGLEYAPLEKVRRFFLDQKEFTTPLDITMLGSGGLLTGFSLGGAKNIIGNFDNLGKSSVTWNNSTYLPDTKLVSIDLVNFVNNRRTAGAATGTITFRFLGNLTVKANGVVLDVPVQSNNVLVWDASSITLDGTSIG